MDFYDFDVDLFFSLLDTTLLLTTLRNSYDFSKVGPRQNLGFLLLAAARVYALNTLPRTSRLL